MQHILFILLFCLFSLQVVYGQAVKDSVRTADERGYMEQGEADFSSDEETYFSGEENNFSPLGNAFDATLPAVEKPVLPQVKHDSLPRFSLNEARYLPYITHASPLYRGDYATSGILLPMHDGAFYGAGSQETLPGIGVFNSATLGYQQRFSERFSLNLSVDATKMTMTHLTGQMFSTSGSLHYQVADNLSFTAFGTYHLGRSYGLGTHRYGGTANFRVSDNFYMRVGAQRTYNMYTGRWETVPIAIPIFKIGDVALGGVDVGGLIYSILQQAAFERRQKRAFRGDFDKAPAGGGLQRIPRQMVAPARTAFPQ